MTLAPGARLGPYEVIALRRTYDVSPDGQRFLLLKQGTSDPLSTPPQVVVVQNWQEALKRLVPTR